MLTGHLAAIFTIFVWGLTFISTKILLRNFSAEEILFIRFLMGWLALWLASRAWLKFQGLNVEACFLAAGFSGITLYFLLENIALEYTNASNVGVIVSTVPLFTGLIDWLFFHAARPALRFYAGFVLAMAGIVLISFKTAEVSVNPTGDILALMAAVAWGFYSGFTKKLTALNLGSLITTRRIFFYGLLLMGPVLWYSGFPATPAIILEPVNLANLLFLGLGASALCFATWTFCLIRLGTARASAYIYLVPVITVLAASVWLSERITLAMVAGMFLVLFGLVLSETRFSLKKAGNIPPSESSVWTSARKQNR